MSLTRAKPKLLAIHRWLALIAGIFVISQGLSGTVSAFRYELTRALHPGAMPVAPQAVQPRLAAVIKAAQKELPGAKAARIDYPRAPGDAYIVRLTARDGTASIVTVDQAGHVTRAGNLWAWPVEAAYAIHENLFSGEAGERGVGFIGLAVLVLAVSGLLYWWPAARFGRILANTIKPQLAKGRVTRELHRAMGVLFALYLIMVAALGLAMAWSPWVQPLIGTVLPFTVQRPKPPAACKPVPAAIDQSVAMAMALRPGEPVKSVRLQARGRIVAVYFRAPAAINPRATDHVWLSACGNFVLATDDKAHRGPGDTLYEWLLPIHSGEWLGLFGRLLSWSAALALVVMGTSGYVLWVLRLKRRKA